MATHKLGNQPGAALEGELVHLGLVLILVLLFRPLLFGGHCEIRYSDG